MSAPSIANVKRMSIAQICALLLQAEAQGDAMLARYGYNNEKTRVAMFIERTLQREMWRRGFMI